MNAINWFEIPATNFDRAVTFYESLLQTTLRREIFAGTPNAVFPYEGDEAVGGAVVYNPNLTTGATGAVVYLNARTGAILDAALSRAESLGGRVIMPKISLGPTGFIALILDSEGNRIGLHTPPQE